MKIYISYNIESGIIKVRCGYVRYIYKYLIDDMIRFKGVINYLLWKIIGVDYRIIKRTRKIGKYMIAIIEVKKTKDKAIKILGYSDIEFIGG